MSRKGYDGLVSATFNFYIYLDTLLRADLFKAAAGQQLEDLETSKKDHAELLERKLKIYALEIENPFANIALHSSKSMLEYTLNKRSHIA